MSSETPRAGNRLPYSFARRQSIFISDQGGVPPLVIYKTGVSPLALMEVRRFLGVPLRLEPVPPERFDELIQQTYESSSNDTMQIAGDLGDDLDLQSLAEQLPETEDLLESEDDAPIIRLINGLLTEAVKENASDIHIEPFESRMRVRFRVDGVLREVLQPSKRLAPLIISRVKVMARLDIAEKRLPQDGRISLKVAGRPVDVRVSTIPSAAGERVVLRLLDKQAGRLDLEHIGMPPAILNTLDRLIHRPNGIILVTGPTGSGKTTTLYSAISRLNQASRNIMTVEDPIEYYLDGIGQTQVNTRVDMTFARGLRSILRQDPDVVMIGEIRDRETAEIAVQASLTGHLVFSTLHTNTATGAVTRLRDMGIEPFLLSSTITGVLAQRLIRLLCHECRESYEAGAAEIKELGLDPSNPPTLYRATGCDQCNHQGYTGRSGLYEMVVLDEALKSMIHEMAAEHTMEEYARKSSPSLRADGVRRILAGDTTVEEVLRATSEELKVEL
ncbi:MAG: type II secretion system ATPase GspE [Proteobacteria bacterium]|nr:type II secretion system ATPase GspE [Pseudomonadota bacterium]MBU1686369.1 type II secretion system ATPase GspE [Pseudomonadota bacterium]